MVYPLLSLLYAITFVWLIISITAYAHIFRCKGNNNYRDIENNLYILEKHYISAVALS